MRFNDLKLTPIALPAFTDEQIQAEPVIQDATIEEALGQGRELTRFFIKRVLPGVIRQDSRTRVNTSKLFVREGQQEGGWHIDTPFLDYDLSDSCYWGVLAIGDRRDMEAVSAVELPVDFVMEKMMVGRFEAWVNEQIQKGDLQVRDVRTGTFVESDFPFIHQGGKVVKNPGYRWIAEVYNPEPMRGHAI